MTSLRSTPFALVMLHFAEASTQAGAVTHHAVQPAHAAAAPEFMWQEAVAFAAVGLLVISRLQEARYPRFYYVSLVSACICTAYGFISGAWPLGLALGAYTVRLVVMRPRRHIRRVFDNPALPNKPSLRWEEPSRLERLFGIK